MVNPAQDRCKYQAYDLGFQNRRHDIRQPYLPSSINISNKVQQLVSNQGRKEKPKCKTNGKHVAVS